ncbi:efflux RND transporter periplasmic adaptor subunit [Hydrogenimonas sp.]
MKKTTKILIAVIAAAALAALGVRAIKHKKAEAAAIPTAKEYAAVVRTTVPVSGEVTLTLPALALVRNENDVAVTSKLSARVVAVEKEGARVQKGAPLVRLDTRDLEAKADALQGQIAAAKMELAAAKSALKSLEATHARTEKLMAVRGASREQYDAEVAKIAEAKAKTAAARSRIRSLSAALKEVKQSLDYAVIASPVDGTVGRALVNPGDMAMPGKPLLRISADRGDYLLIRVPDDIVADALLYRGKSYGIRPLRHTSGGLKEYRTPVLDLGLVSGSRIGVDLVVYRGVGTLLPVEALLDTGERKVVFTVENGRAVAHEVTVVAEGEQGIVVGETAWKGHPVVVAKPDMLLKLLAGVPVRVREPEAGNRGTE